MLYFPPPCFIFFSFEKFHIKFFPALFAMTSFESVSMDSLTSEDSEPSQAPPRRLLTRKSTFRLDKDDPTIDVISEALQTAVQPPTKAQPVPVVTPQKKTTVSTPRKSASTPRKFTSPSSNNEAQELILDVQLLRESFEIIRPNGLPFVKQFYATLFAKHPPLHQLFTRFDQNHIEKKLVNILVMIVENIENEDMLAFSLSDLGRKHVGIGVIPPYFKLMGDALIETMEKYFEATHSTIWTKATEESWRSAYSIVAGIMIESMTASTKTRNLGRQGNSFRLDKPQQATPQSSTEGDDDMKKPSQSKGEDHSFVAQAQFMRQRTRIVNGRFEQSSPVSPFPQLDEEKPKGKLLRSLSVGVKQSVVQSIERVVSWEALEAYAAAAYEAFTEAPTWAVVVGIFLVYMIVLRVLPNSEWLNQLVGSIDEISMLIGVILYIKEAPDRRKQFHYHAWGAIDSAASSKVSQTRIMALQDLNSDGVSLRGFHGVGLDLSEVRLPAANLRQCQLAEAKLDDCDLSAADLSYATMVQASLVRANLARAKLDFAALTQSNCNGASFERTQLFCVDFTGANLSGSDFRFASLKGVCFDGAILAGADFTGADVDVRALSKGQLSSTRLPDGRLSE